MNRTLNAYRKAKAMTATTQALSLRLSEPAFTNLPPSFTVSEKDKTYIRLGKDTVEEMHSKLLQRAYDGKAPKGGYDFPANQALLHCSERDGDYSVGVFKDTGVVAENFSHLKNVAPAIMRPEPVPKRSAGPFEQVIEDMVPPGLFGKALLKFCQFSALLRAFQGDESAYRKMFVYIWGLAGEKELDGFLATTRSTGKIAYGGVKRKQVPVLLALTGAQAVVHVTEIGRQRQDYNRDLLIDWPRLKAIVRAIGVTLACDDRVAFDLIASGENRLYFRIQRGVVPEVPSGITFVKFGYPVDFDPKKSVLMKQMAQLREFLARQVGLVYPKTDRIEFHAIPPQDVLQAALDINRPVFYKIDNNMLNRMVEGNLGPDRDSIVPAPGKGGITQVIPTADDALIYLAALYNLRSKGAAPKAKDVFNMVVGYEEGNRKVSHALMDLVRRVYPDETLSNILILGRFANKGEQWVRDVIREFTKGNYTFSQHGLERAWCYIRSSNRALSTLGEYIERGFRRIEVFNYSQLYMPLRIRHALENAGSMTAGIGELIKQQAVYWHNRKLSSVKGKSHSAEKVKAQVTARILRTVRLVVDGENTVTYDINTAQIAFVESFDHYLANHRVREDHRKALIGRVRHGYVNSLELMGRTMDQVLPSGCETVVTFFQVAVYVHSELMLFCADFEDILSRVLVDRLDEVEDDASVADELDFVQPEEQQEPIVITASVDYSAPLAAVAHPVAPVSVDVIPVVPVLPKREMKAKGKRQEKAKEKSVVTEPNVAKVPLPETPNLPVEEPKKEIQPVKEEKQREQIEPIMVTLPDVPKPVVSSVGKEPVKAAATGKFGGFSLKVKKAEVVAAMKEPAKVAVVESPKDVVAETVKEVDPVKEKPIVKSCEDVKSPVMPVAPVPVAVKASSSAKVAATSKFGGFSLKVKKETVAAALKEPVAPKVQEVELAFELEEDGFKLNDPLIASVVAKHPKYVPLTLYNTILDQVKNAVAAEHSVAPEQSELAKKVLTGLPTRL